MRDAQIEKVARAIVEATDGPWDFISAAGQEAARVQARAAIAAMNHKTPILERIRSYFWRKRLVRNIRRHIAQHPTTLAFEAALATAAADNAAWKKEQRRARARARFGLPLALALGIGAMQHFEPDPCHPQPHHAETGKCATEHDTHQEESR